ncbi:MAG: hypothetical protein K6E54_09685 [Bacteroidaceae bacterium]|jgi:hypothetical protein|nr:hypothetical protein [Bacteroidaceae bacterium]
MKKSIIFAFAMTMALAINANTVSKNSKGTTYSATEAKYDKEGNVNVINVDAYNVAEIDVPARVRIVKGDKYGVNVIALDKTAEKAIHYTVKNGVLRFYSKAAEELNNGTVVINLVVPTTPEIRTASNLDTYSIQ